MTCINALISAVPWLDRTFEEVEAEVKEKQLGGAKSGDRSHDGDSGSRRTSKGHVSGEVEVEVQGEEVDVRIDIASDG